jgi:hypothetical protein
MDEEGKTLLRGRDEGGMILFGESRGTIGRDKDDS